MKGGCSYNSGRTETDFEGKQEMEYFASSRRCKSIPCTKFFSIEGCRFGERCHFSHDAFYGYNPLAPNASAQMTANPNFAERKTLLCYKYYSRGCVESDKCPYAHGEEELRGPITYVKIPSDMRPMPISRHVKRLPPQTSFDANAKMKLSFSAPRTCIGGTNFQLLISMTGAKLLIEDHESDPSLVKFKLEGYSSGVQLACQILEDLIASMRSAFRTFKIKPCEDKKTLLKEAYQPPVQVKKSGIKT